MEAHLLLTFIFSVLFIPSSIAIKFHCDNSFGNFTTNSTFQTNLNLLLSGLTSNASTSGYSEGSLGTIPDRVYGLVQCRGDTSRESCGTCLSAASQDIQDSCPLLKGANIWYDNCQLRYSSRRFASTPDTGYRLLWWNNQIVSSEWPRFNESLVKLLNELIQYSSYNTTAAPPLFGTGEIPGTSEFPKIYAFVQCTRDLTADGCNQCLNTILQYLPNCCDKKIGGRVLAYSCNFRYEIYKIINGTSKLELPGVGNASLPTQGPTRPPVPPPTFNSTTPNNQTEKESKKNHTRTILAVVISVGAAILLISLICCTFRRKQKKETQKYHRADKQELPLKESLLLDLPTIRKITNNFSESNKLGEGGFGGVYKGELADGQQVAVKRLSRGSSQGINELKNEVVLLAKLQHRNLVRLLGVCLEEKERILLYEYVQNKSLDKVLFDPNRKAQLNWGKRYKIIGGIARGLLYLHEESQVKIIHRDLKASNILLDSDMNPKISDFGLARLLGGDQTQDNTSKVAGTIGYMPPEYVMGGNYSIKSDVYGFGVLVLEIVTGRKNGDCFTSEDTIGLLSYVWDHWSTRRVQLIIDASFGRNYSASEALRCIQIGLLCVQKSPADRPTMSTVVLMLSSNSVTIGNPTGPAFLSIISFDQENNTNSSEDRHVASRSIEESQNELSITEQYPR